MRSVPICLGGAAFVVFAMLPFAGMAQVPANADAGVGAGSDAKGEPWTATTIYEYYGARDREPAKRERKQTMICAAPGKFDSSNAANAELPPEYKNNCWVNDKRVEMTRQQIKYTCKDGTTLEAVTRRDSDSSFGSQIVANVPKQGAVSITRSFRRAPGTCDVTKALPEVPVPSPAPAAPPKK